MLCITRHRADPIESTVSLPPSQDYRLSRPSRKRAASCICNKVWTTRKCSSHSPYLGVICHFRTLRLHNATQLFPPLLAVSECVYTSRQPLRISGNFKNHTISATQQLQVTVDDSWSSYPLLTTLPASCRRKEQNSSTLARRIASLSTHFH